MNISDNALQATASFIGLVVFFTIPILKTILGEPLQMVPLAVAIIAGLGFGLLGGYYMNCYKKEKRKLMITSDEDTDDFLDTKIGEKCPKCKSKLMMISRKDGRLLMDSWIGLVYCMNCDFEISKERWDNGEREP